MSTQKNRKKASSALIVIGLALVILGTLYGNAWALATINYNNAEMFTFTQPDGTSSNPYSLTGGTSFPVQADVYLSGTGSSGAQALTVTFTDFSNNVITLTWNGYSDPYGGLEFVGTWSIPSANVNAVQVTFKAVDSSNGQTTTYQPYVSVATTLPTGYFTVNGQQMTKNTVLNVTNPTLQFDGYVTSQQSLVQNMRVVVENSAGTIISTITLSLASGNHYGPQTFTLPSTGKYTVLGYIIGNGINVQEMSFFANMGGSYGPLTINIINLLGAAMVLLGLYERKAR
jgi:hypothetical protein